MKYLIENGATPDEENIEGDTPLCLANKYENHLVSNYLTEIIRNKKEAAAQALARQSLYVKFDPLIGGRPSIMPPKTNTIQEDDNETMNNNNDLIAMNSPSPPKQAPRYVLR